MQLLVLFKKPRDRETFPARHARPGLFAGVRPFVDIQVGCQFVGLATHVTTKGTLIGVKPDVNLQVADLGEGLFTDGAAVGPLSSVDP